MTTSVRYSCIENKNAGALTFENYPSNSDGEDKQLKVFKRIIGAGDIGNGAGQLGDPYGAIAFIVPKSSNVLMIEMSVIRGGDIKIEGAIPYNYIDNQVYPIPNPTDQCEVVFLLGLDNTVRIADKGHAGLFPLIEGDIIFIKVYIGTPTSALDALNI